LAILHSQLSIIPGWANVSPGDQLLRMNLDRYCFTRWIQRLAIKTKIWNNHKQYIRFILLGRSRVGTNFLRLILNSHPQIITYGELFQKSDSISWIFPEYPQTRHIISAAKNHPIKFLENNIFRGYPKRIAAVGFKLLYYHAHSSALVTVWDYLKSQKDIRIIHIKRLNVLKAHISRQRAVMTDKWVNLTGEQEFYSPIELDYDECLDTFIKTRQWEETYDAIFSNHPMIEVLYEDLAGDYLTEIERVLKFLGVKFADLAPQTFKQSNQPLSLSISNYAELKMKFRGTEWEEFFEE
jgi:LPS sulfotransferase NodH